MDLVKKRVLSYTSRSMSNEFLFLLQIFLVLGFCFGALRLGASALISLIALQGVIANLFVVKQMQLFGLTVTCSDVFAIGSMIGLNLLQEYFGKAYAQRAIKISFLTLLFFVAVSQIHLGYSPALADQTHGAFYLVLSSTPRIIFASIAVYYIVQKVDVWLFGKLKNLFGDKYLSIRMGVSLVITQAIDTVLFSFLGLYGLVAEIGSVILLSFFVKCLVIGAGSPLAALAKPFLPKKVEE